MYLPNCTIDTETLIVPNKIRFLIKDFLERLQYKVPVNSRIVFKITKDNKGFCGRLSVRSIQFNISLEYASEQISKLILLLAIQCDLDIRAWHHERRLIS